MNFIFILFLLSSALFTPISRANAPENADGNRIAEPLLTDYVRAERTPGFSPITDVVDQHGNKFSE